VWTRDGNDQRGHGRSRGDPRPFDLLPNLAGVTVPTLVLHGDHDFVPLSAAERVAGALPAARLVVIPDCGHCAYLEAMDTVYAEVASFLRD